MEELAEVAIQGLHSFSRATRRIVQTIACEPIQLDYKYQPISIWLSKVSRNAR